VFRVLRASEVEVFIRRSEVEIFYDFLRRTYRYAKVALEETWRMFSNQI
jgi:hypothetical protein